ncbi:copper chaperone CopZ [Pontibacter ummariensis]|uniref:Mercuric transport protein MerT n=1 Tax=Pontibacter ummariensis TaxID=1610492 RepID=A0A239JFY3_9BACT|nr:mercuric transport protein MerTP [Pontibacter ummariensis]PRY08400.1 copper chaperone CopZ [Pontibacter ummariensis]SNT04512.1 Copper chaperone CopZ [Pontibacter ummariensis]
MRTSPTKLLGTGLLAALLASLCCIAPLLALVGGVTGAISAFGWVEPFRPYLAGITVAVLALAWYQRLKAEKSAAACACEGKAKPTFWKSNKFLLAVSCVALLLLAFPEYAGAFYKQQHVAKAANVQTDFTQSVKLQVKGMTCAGCEAHVNQEIGKLPGVFSVSTSYEKGSAVIKYDSTKVKPMQILQAARKTGYLVAIEDKKP